MKKYEMIKKNSDFNEILTTGKKVKNEYFMIFYIPSKYYPPKFGLAVNKNSGNAYIRNKMKRITRNIIDQNRNMFKNQLNYIIMIKSSCLLVKYDKLNVELNNLIREINEKDE